MAQTVSFEPSCVKIDCVVWAVDLRKKKNTHIHTYIHTYTKNAHWCYISPPRGGAISQAIAMKFGIPTDLDYVIYFVKFGNDRM